MGSSAMVPKPFDIRDAKRRQEEAARLAERRDGARRAAATTVSSGGRLDVDGGDLTILNGGNAAVKDGGRFLVEGGGSMEVHDDGQIVVRGDGINTSSGEPTQAAAALRTQNFYSSFSGGTFRQPGIFFTAGDIADGDPAGASLYSFSGDDVQTASGKRPITAGPLVEPGVNSNSYVRASPLNARLGATAFYGIDPQPADQRTECLIQLSPDAYYASLYRNNVGPVMSMTASIADPVLRLFASGGVDVSGPFTVNGSPVVGGVTSVAGKTGAVTLVKADVGLSNVDNTSDANKPVATAAKNGLMPAADKAKLDGATAAATPSTLIQLDTAGRAKVANPSAATDIANKTYVDTAVNALKPGAWTAIPAATGWEPQDVDPTKCKVVNGITYFRGKFHRIGASTTAGNNSGTALLLGTVPADASPDSPQAFVCLAVWGATGVTSPCRVEVQADGRILMFGIGDQGVFTAFSVTTATYVFVSSITYPTS